MEIIVNTQHHIDGHISFKSETFKTEEEALEYAQSIECTVVKVYVEGKGLVLYSKPGILETTE